MLSILTVDDEIVICEMIAEFLTKKGYKVRRCCSGEEALKLIDDERPDLVILDLIMPGIGGEATLKKIKELYHNLPVIILTTLNSGKKAMELLNQGASDYFTKPIDLYFLEKNLSIWESIQDQNKNF